MIAALCRVLSILPLLASAALAADGVTVIETAGVGTLTVCSDLPLYGCRVFDRVPLPKRLAIGDRVPLAFDNGPARMEFPVVRIIKNGIRCTVLRQADGNGDKIDNIKVPSCLDVTDTP
jgi:hypothetical protein